MKNNRHNKPFKLEEDTSKKVFSVPNDYFDKLPSIIQTKALESSKPKTMFTSVGVLRLAIPSVLLLIIVGYFGYNYQNSAIYNDAKIESMLAEISTEDMVSFLDQTDLSSQDLLEFVSFDGEKIDDFELNFEDISDEELEMLLNDFEMEDINNI